MTERYLPDEIIERIILWKEINDAKQTIANMLAIRRQYDDADDMQKQRTAEYEQTYSLASMYARNDSINEWNLAKKLCKVAETISTEATLALHIAQAKL